MEKSFFKSGFRPAKLMFALVLGILLTVSCKEDYIYDEILPDWLGSSIYEYLEEDGNYTNYVKLINDLDYKDVFSLTGSKTLFVADDDAFAAFYANNPWGVKKYEDLTLAQKKLILNFSMINNAYLIETMSNYYSGGTFFEGTAMRRATALSPFDSLSFDLGNVLPTSKYFDNYRDKGLYLMKDATVSPAVYFTQKFLNKHNITNEDISYISGSIFNGGQMREKDDMHLFDVKIIERDIVCKNGYIHKMDKVLIPHTNMANYIQTNVQTSIFSKLLERFSLPVYEPAINSTYKSLHPEFSDSIFVKKYLAVLGGTSRLPNGQTAPNLLPFDPGWNAYSVSQTESSLPADMAVIFAPSDEAMNNYFNSGVGELLRLRFGTWENIPDNIIVPFLKRHMRSSLIESVPSKFSKMVDGENYKLPVDKSHILGSYTGVNGQVFITSEVYPPVDYISVYSPVLLSENTRIMDYAIKISETSVDGTIFEFYKLYLNSLVSKYSLLVPTDEYLENYIDPIAYAQDVPAVLKYKYIKKTNSVTAYIYKYDKVNKTIGDFVDSIPSNGSTANAAFIKNRLWDILDSHIVVGDITSGKDYYVTKGNDIIKVSGAGSSMKIQGGQDIIDGNNIAVSKIFSQSNGKTFFIEKNIQPSLQSVYGALSSNPEFSEFFNLLSGVPEDYVAKIFDKQGVDYRVKFFNAYRYTVYVPKNEAIVQALAQGKIKAWSDIDAIADAATRKAEIDKMVRFLRYHFQDNTVFFGETINNQYQTATIRLNGSFSYWNTALNKYYKIGVVGTAGSMKLTTENQGTANVTALNNIVVKDYIFNRLPTAYKNVDGTGATTGALFNTSGISNSASAVIHQIDNILTFE